MAGRLTAAVHARRGPSGPGVEAIPFGTRPSRPAQAVVERDPERALAAVAARRRLGGTRIGASLREVSVEWGPPDAGPRRRPVIVSEGERDDPDLVASGGWRGSRGSPAHSSGSIHSRGTPTTSCSRAECRRRFPTRPLPSRREPLRSRGARWRPCRHRQATRCIGADGRACWHCVAMRLGSSTWPPHDDPSTPLPTRS
jgi:VWA domain containing CoxE-like protein